MPVSQGAGASYLLPPERKVKTTDEPIPPTLPASDPRAPRAEAQGTTAWTGVQFPSRSLRPWCAQGHGCNATTRAQPLGTAVVRGEERGAFDVDVDVDDP